MSRSKTATSSSLFESAGQELDPERDHRCVHARQGEIEQQIEGGRLLGPHVPVVVPKTHQRSKLEAECYAVSPAPGHDRARHRTFDVEGKPDHPGESDDENDELSEESFHAVARATRSQRAGCLMP